jgi:hypothetical protein
MQIKIESPPSYWPAQLGWSNSRDRDQNYNWEVASIDAPVNELPTVLLEFVDFTILEREIFTSSRSHVIWARTSRVDNPMLFTTPDEFHRPLVHGKLRAAMVEAEKAGVSQDEWRLYLPLVAHTSWTARMSFRDLVKMHLYFQYLADVCTPHINWRLSQVAIRLHEVARKFMPDMATMHKAVESMKLIKYLHEGDVLDNYSSTKTFRTVTAVMPIALRAQLVRHRGILFVDDFFKVLRMELFAELTLKNTLRVQATATQSQWATVLGQRACWISQADLWQPLTNKFDSGVLPCADDVCPYTVDAQARVEGKDPGVPCPRYCNLYHQPKEPFKARMRGEANMRGVQKDDFWKQEIEQ